MQSQARNLSLLVLTIILGSVQAIMPMSIDLYLPALPTIANELNVTAGSVQFTVAIFMIGVALGQVVYGPITDKFGRKKPLLFGFGLYVIGAIICASAPTITWLVVGRFIQALGASAGAVISSAIARDLWSGKMLADRLSLLVLVLGVAPILAPSLGGVILGQWDWHGLFWFLVLYGVVVASAVTFLPETSSATERSDVRLADAGHTYLAIMRNVPFMLYVLTGACAIGMLLTYITSSSFIYIEMLGTSPSTFGMIFGINAIGFVGAAQLNRILLRRFRLEQMAHIALAVAIVVGAALAVLEQSGFASVTTVTMLFSLLGMCVGFSMPNIAALAFGHIKERMGSASALQGTTQSVVGGIAGTLVGLLSNGSIIPTALIIGGFASVASVLLVIAQWTAAQQPPVRTGH